MEQNKIRTYIFYAIGEIALVMIGILLALQVNNWSQANQQEASERLILNELLTNLQQDSVDHAINIQWYERAEKSARIVVENLENRIPWHDSMAVHLGNMYTHGITTLNKSAYENLKSNGFNLISNDSIRIALTNLHSISYALIDKVEQSFVLDNNNNMVLPVLTSRLKMDQWFHALPLNYEALMDDAVFQNTIRYRAVILGYARGNVRSANRKVHQLRLMIKRELRKG